MSPEVDGQSINWGIVLWHIHIHVLGCYGFWLAILSAQWLTVVYAMGIISLGCLGVTVGAHRLWAHRTFRTTLLTRLFFLLGHTLAGVGSVHNWVLRHRMHHKFYGTERDPYDHRKGFIHCHLIVNNVFPVAEIEHASKEIDMRDIEEDLPVQIQKNFYWLFLLAGMILPVYIPIAYWDEHVATSIMVLCFLRLAVTTNVAWLVNSAFLVWNLAEGEKYPPDDNYIFILNRSRWPAYHYLFPWDFKCGEFGSYELGWGTTIIRLLRDVGLATHLKTISAEDLREVFYKVADKKINIEEATYELKHISDCKADMDNLVFRG